MKIILGLYFDYVTNYHPKASKVVVFDYYSLSTTKSSEQKRRKTSTTPCADIAVSAKIPIPGDKKSFLSNQNNKQSFIDLLGSYMEEKGVTVIHAKEDGDADVRIVRKALILARSLGNVLIIADDTDVFALLVYHSLSEMNLSMKTKSQTIDIRRAQNALGQQMCQCILFAHAMSGCDTTSAFFGIGITKAMKIIQKSEDLQKMVQVFGDDHLSVDDISKIGESFILHLYGGKSLTLDSLRESYFKSSKYTSPREFHRHLEPVISIH